MLGNETAREKRNLPGADRSAKMFRIFQNPCLGSFRCFWHRLFASYQRSPPRTTCVDISQTEHIRTMPSISTFRVATAMSGGQLGLERSWNCPSRNPQGSSIDTQSPGSSALLALLQHPKDTAVPLPTRPFDHLPAPRLLQLCLPIGTDQFIKRREDIKRTRAQFI